MNYIVDPSRTLTARAGTKVMPSKVLRHVQRENADVLSDSLAYF
jgi:hypothetical protein